VGADLSSILVPLVLGQVGLDAAEADSGAALGSLPMVQSKDNLGLALPADLSSSLVPLPVVGKRPACPWWGDLLTCL